MITQIMLCVAEGVKRVCLGVSITPRVGNTLRFLACRQVRCDDTVIGANEAFIKGDYVLPTCGVILMTEVQVATTTHQTTHHIPLPPQGGGDQLITDC